MGDILADNLPEIEPEELFIQMEEININPDAEELNKFVEQSTEYWTIKEAAKWLEVTERTVQNYVKKGLLVSHHRGSHNKLLFSHFDVIELGWKLNVDAMKFTGKERCEYIAKQLLSTTIGRNALYEVIYAML